MALKEGNSVKMWAYLAIPAVLAAATVWAADQPVSPSPRPGPGIGNSSKAEPGLTYGHSDELPLPKTIMFSCGPDEIAADAEEWAKHGVQAFFVDFVARDWSSDIWAADGKPWTIGASDEMFQKVKKATEVCNRIGSDTFLKIAFDHFFEWFNDTAWDRIDNNFRQFAIFARDSGCTGLALDIEYVGEQYSYDWPGYDYKGYTRPELAAKIRQRMTKVMSIMCDEFPNMVFLTFPEPGLSLGNIIHTAWIEEAARRNAPGGIHYCTESTYRLPNIRHMFGRAWVSDFIMDRFLSERAKTYWKDKCSIAAGLWPFGFDYQTVYMPGMPLEEWRQAYAASLMMSRKYTWIYSGNCREMLVGRAKDKYPPNVDIPAYLKVMVDREIVTTPKYVAVAKDLRSMVLRNYSADLGLAVVPGIGAPYEGAGIGEIPLAEVPSRDVLAQLWDAAKDYYEGKEVRLSERFGTVGDWIVVGPFKNDSNWTGYETAYPPETGIDLDAIYDGINGPVKWTEYHRLEPFSSVNFGTNFNPSVFACAYALVYVTSPKEQPAQLRIGTNDMGKMWFNGKLVHEYPYEGWAGMDRHIVPVTLPQGKSPILVKVCNGLGQWGFIFRITDTDGMPLKDIRYTLQP